MKIDLEEDEILGTYKIKKNGIITGLSKYIGRKVLVVLLPKKSE